MPNSLADRATSDMLIGPDWAMNLEICDILNHDPGQARDFVKGLKKRLRSKNPKVQLLALKLLETVVKHCGHMIHMHIADKDIPHELVKIVKKKPDFHVKEKIIVLIGTWQEEFGGPQGRYPQFFLAYHDLLRAGVIFPLLPERSTPVFTPTQTRPQALYPHPLKNYDKKAEKLEASCDSEMPVLSLAEIKNARAIMDVLVEMLNALEPGNKEEGAKQEVIVELVEQCRQYRQRVVHLVNSTSDEELLCQVLALNDDLQNVLSKYDAKKPKQQKYLQALVDIDNFDDKNQDDNNESSDRRSNGSGSICNQAPLQQLLLPAPPEPNSMTTASPRSGPHVDLLSGEEYGRISIRSLALVPINETTAPSAIEQNMLALSGMHSPRKTGDNNYIADISFPGEHACTVASQFQQPIYEHASFVQRAKSSHGDPSWDNHVVDTQQQQHIGAIEQGGALPPPPWEIELAESSQPLTLQQQQSDPQFYDHNTPYSYSIQDSVFVNQDTSYQMPSTSSSSYLQQPKKQLKPEDNLFGDLVNMAKSKTNKSVN